MGSLVLHWEEVGVSSLEQFGVRVHGIGVGNVFVKRFEKLNICSKRDYNFFEDFWMFGFYGYSLKHSNSAFFVSLRPHS